RRTAPGTTPPKLTIGLGEDRRTVEAAVEREDGTIYRVWLNATAGKIKVSVALAGAVAAADAPRERAGDGTPQNRGGRQGLSVDSIVVRGPHKFDPSQLPEPHRRILFATPEIGDESRLATARQ